ncbi:MAG: hypothetical protein ACOC2Z_12730, partial [Coleofasciculus sp.]
MKLFRANSLNGVNQQITERLSIPTPIDGWGFPPILLRQGKAMADAADVKVEPVEACPPSPDYNELRPLLRWLDRRLEQAVAEATAAYGRERATKTQGGIHIDPDEVERLLARKAGEPIFAGGRDEFESSLSKWVNPHSRLG